MSIQHHHQPECQEQTEGPLERIVVPKEHDLGGFSVRRVLPTTRKRSVGGFIFFDEMGPAEFPPGQGIDVRPHPHIRLETVTYLFEGEILHRDSLGNELVIKPGAMNWMTAGKGIVHSERTRSELCASGQRLHGLQLWVALPKPHELADPTFTHYPAEKFASVSPTPGCSVRVLLGEAFGVRSAVKTLSPLLYLDVQLEKDTEVQIPASEEERAIYPVRGALNLGDSVVEQSTLGVLRAGATPSVQARTPCRFVVLGGAPLDGRRTMYWNFVSSDPSAIEQAKDDWREGRFGTIPGDDKEFIPLPEDA